MNHTTNWVRPISAVAGRLCCRIAAGVMRLRPSALGQMRLIPSADGQMLLIPSAAGETVH